MSKTGAPAADAASIDALTKGGLVSAQALFTALGDLAKVAIDSNPVLQLLRQTQQRSSCDIPPPCWLPRSLGEVRSVACPGGTASLRIRVTNCQPAPSKVEVAARPGADTELEPPSATLEAMERKWFGARLSVPQDAGEGQKIEILLWILGCNAHYLRWTVEVAGKVHGSCHEVEVEDCPDHVHHWYDHFYCHRPCFNPAKRRTGNE